MPPDPRWLEILKASGWQTLAVTVAAALVIDGNAKKLFPTPLDPRIVQAAEVAVVVCACLTFASIGSSIVKASKGLRTRLAQQWGIRQAKHQVAAEIPQMTPKEREIVSYLLRKNQKMFTCTSDGGYANTLISKGIVVCALLGGQVFIESDVPFKIPDPVWDVLLKHKANFPYTKPKPGETEVYPWHIHWMSR